MSKPVQLLLNGGLNSRQDPSQFQANELTEAVGAYYRPGDPISVYKIDGRSLYAASGQITSGQPIKGVVGCVFDSGTGANKLVAYSNSGLFYGDIAGSSQIHPLYSGWGASGTLMGGIHNNDHWYLYNGEDLNVVLDAFGGIRQHGMTPADATPNDDEIQLSGIPASLVLYRPASGINETTFSGQVDPFQYPYASGQWITTNNTWNDIPLAFDAIPTQNVPINQSAAWVKSNKQGDNEGFSYKFHVVKFTTFPSGNETGRRLFVDYEVIHNISHDVNANQRGGVFLEIQYSLNAGATWNVLTHFNAKVQDNTHGALTAVSPELAVNNSGVQVRGIMFDESWRRNQWVARIMDVRIGNGGLAAQTQTSGVCYGYTEYDRSEDLQSVIAYNPNPFVVSGFGGVFMGLPAVPQNSNADSYFIYRTFAGGTPPQDFAKIGEVEVGISGFVDPFTHAVDVPDAGLLAYPMVRVLDTYYDRDYPPPPFISINQFKASFVGVNPDQPRKLWYSVPGRVESYSKVYVIDKFPMPEHDFLRGSMTVGDTLMILADGGLMRTDQLPVVNEEGVLATADITRIDGQPGCVGYRAFTAYSVNGAPRGAWVSPYGVHITTSTTCSRVSDDLDWENTIDQSTLGTSILFWDKERLLLYLIYDANGDAVNDSVLFFHMAPEHLKGSEANPKITGPHPCRIQAINACVPEGQQLIFTGGTDGQAYVEWSGSIDTSRAFNASGLVPFQVVGGKIYDDAGYDEFSVFKGVVRHDDWGSNEAAALTWRYGRDHDGFESAVTKSVSLSGNRNTEIFIGRAGEWGQVAIAHSGIGSGRISNLKLLFQGEGPSGNR